MKMPSDIILVSAALRRDQGGTAVVGRLLLRAAADYCDQHDLRFSVLHLSQPTDITLPHVPIHHFFDNQRALALALVRAQLHRKKPLLIFDHLGPARVQAFLPSSLRASYLLFIHGVEIWRPLRWDHRRALCQAAVILSNSEYTRNRSKQMHPWLPAIYPTVLALEQREPSDDIDKALLDQMGTGFILIVGRMVVEQRHKGHDDLLAVLPQLVERCPSTRLVIVGQGTDRPRLEQIAKDLNVREQVIFTGFVNDATLKAIYRKCAVFVMLSMGDGFGLVYLEAMRAGKPCIGLTGSSAEEIIISEITGKLVERDDPEHLVSALLVILTNPDLARQMGEAGLRREQTHFSQEAFRNKIQAHLAQLTRSG